MVIDKIMWAIKEFKELLEAVVKSSSWEKVYLFPKENYEALKREIMKESHIEVAPYTLVNKYDVSTRLIEVDDITSEIAKHPYNVQQELRFILNDRKNKWFKTNWFKHLWNIYENRFLNK